MFPLEVLVMLLYGRLSQFIGLLLELSNGVLINYGRASVTSETNNFVTPVLTANGTLGGDHFAVDKYSGGVYGGAFYTLFDGTTSQYSILTGSTCGWKFYNPFPIKISSLTITNLSSYSHTKTGNIYASNTDSNYQLIATYTSPSPTASAVWDLPIDATEAYKYFVLESTDTTRYTPQTGYTTGIAEIKINATYTTTALNSITFPYAHKNTNYSCCVNYIGAPAGESYLKTRTTTGLTFQNETNASSVCYISIGE